METVASRRWPVAANAPKLEFDHGRPVDSIQQTILVVDDDASVRSTVSAILRRAGYEVATEADGDGALDAARRLRPDLVLLDIVMPGCDGLEVCRQLKADVETRLIPVVLLSGLSALDDRVHGLDAGADDLLSKPFETVELLARVKSLLKLKRYTDDLERAESVLVTLARSIEGKDPYTEGHCERLSALATELGRRLRLPEEDLTSLDRAGIVHDIGKLAVPDTILLKEGPLTPEEWTIIRKHPAMGEHICTPIRSFHRVLPIIRHHHEKFDGSGYPDGLKGIEVPLTARVLQVVDVYDALTTKRTYKPAFPPLDALETMDAEVKMGWWDPDVYAEFRRMILDGDKAALVLRPRNQDRDDPRRRWSPSPRPCPPEKANHAAC